MYRHLLIRCFVLVGLLAPQSVWSEDESSGVDAKSIWVTSIAQIGSSDQFVAASADGLLLREATVYSFAASNPYELQPLYAHPTAVWCVASTRDGSKVASVDYRGNLMVFDPATSEAAKHEKAFERWCQALLVAPDDASLVAGNEAGKLMVWSLAENKVTKSIELAGHAVTGLAISPDGSQLAASDGGGNIHLVKWPELEVVGKIAVSEQTVWKVAYIDGGKQLLTGSSDRQLYRVEAKPEAKAEAIAKGSDWITQLAVSPSGQVAAGEVGGRLHFPSSGGIDSMDASSGVWTLCWNGESQIFAGTRKDGIVMAGRSWKWTEPAPAPTAEPDPEAAEENAGEDAGEGETDKGSEEASSDGDDEAGAEKSGGQSDEKKD